MKILAWLLIFSAFPGIVFSQKRTFDKAVRLLENRICYKCGEVCSDCLNRVFSDSDGYYQFTEKANSSRISKIEYDYCLYLYAHEKVQDPIDGTFSIRYMSCPLIICFKQVVNKNKYRVEMASENMGTQKGILRFISDSAFSLNPGWFSKNEYYKIGHLNK